MSAGAWHPDPTGRFAQRYHDGENWTDHVADASGAQQSDPFSQSEPHPPLATPAQPSSPPPPSEAMTASTFTASTPAASGPNSIALVVSALGAAAVLAGMFLLPWIEFGGIVSQTFDRADLAELVEFASFGGSVTAISETYFTVGWIVAIVAAAVAVAACVVRPLRIPAMVACAAGAAWHMVTLVDLTEGFEGVAIGAYAVPGGLLLCLLGAAIAAPKT